MRATFLAAAMLVCVPAVSSAQGIVPVFGPGSSWHVKPIPAHSTRKKKAKATKARGVRQRTAVPQRIDCDHRGCFEAGEPANAGGRFVIATGKAVYAGGAAVYAGGADLVGRARAHLGKSASDLGLPRSLWCSDFMNKITHGGTGSRLAASWARAGRPAAHGCVGCVAVMSRGKRGGHVGVVSGYDAAGNPIIVSGNHNRRVAEAVYPRGRIYAYRHL